MATTEQPNNQSNEDTRTQLELINQALAELLVNQKPEKPCKSIGFKIQGTHTGADGGRGGEN